MAKAKNSDRRKRKYSNQASRTEKNKQKKLERHAKRTDRLRERTKALIGSVVKVRTGEGIKEGTVTYVFYPKDDSYPKRNRSNGAYLNIKSENKSFLVSRTHILGAKALSKIR